MTRTRYGSLGLVAGVLALGAACDLNADFLFPEAIPDVPGIVDLGVLTPVQIGLDNPSGATQEERDAEVAHLRSEILYGELGPTGTAEIGGISFSFEGFNGPACIWIDPELLFFNQSVAPTNPDPLWSYPDNVYDDGDLDLSGGLTVYYTGTPGERMGNFVVTYQDALGHTIPVDLLNCESASLINDSAPGAHGGRGAPEFCTISDTLETVSYTVVMEQWSLPLDDNRMGYGLLFTEGDCGNLRNVFATPGTGGVGSGLDQLDVECVVMGEAVKPGSKQGARAKLDLQGGGDGPLTRPEMLGEGRDALPGPSWVGIDEVPSWGRSIGYETAYCEGTVPEYCQNERETILGAGKLCSWDVNPIDTGDGLDVERCFCGDLRDTPSGGAF